MRITWKAQPSHGAKVFYRVLRGKGQDVLCGGRLNNAADDCHLYADDVGATRSTTFVDHPGRGPWTYHVGVAANWLDDPKLGDVYVVSRPVAAWLGGRAARSVSPPPRPWEWHRGGHTRRRHRTLPGVAAGSWREAWTVGLIAAFAFYLAGIAIWREDARTAWCRRAVY